MRRVPRILVGGELLCPKCELWKPLWDFNNAKNRSHGVSGLCRNCVCAQRRKWKLENPEESKKRSRNYYWKNRDKEIARGRLYRNTYKERTTARTRVRTAKIQGVLRKHNCEICLGDNPQAHHQDYSKPLDVTWLCQRCHFLLHAKLKNNFIFIPT